MFGIDGDGVGWGLVLSTCLDSHRSHPPALQVATAPVGAAAQAAMARGDIRRSCVVVSGTRCDTASGSTVQREPIKVQINCSVLSCMSIQQASVLSRRGEEVSERKCQESCRLL